VETFVKTIARRALFFDGTTPEDSAVGYTTPPTQNCLRTFKSTPETPVGRFSTRDLGSLDAERPLAISYRLIGSPVPGPTRIEFRSAAPGDTDAGYGPTDFLLSTHPLETTWSPWSVLGGTDRVWGFHPEGDEATLEIRVVDFVLAVQLGLFETIDSPADSALSPETRVVAIAAGVPEQLEPWTASVLYAVVTAAGNNDVLQLPLLADVPEGSRLRLYRASGRWFNVIATGGATINGSAFPLRITADSQGAYIEATAAGWVASMAPDNTNAGPIEGTANVPSPLSRLRTRIEWTITGAGQVLQIPPIGDVAIDQEVEVVVVGVAAGGGGYVAPSAGQNLDGVTDRRVPLVRLGDAAIFRVVAPGAWTSYTNGNDVNADTIAVVADPALGAVGAWSGVRFYAATYAAPGSFTLPTAPQVGQEIIVRPIGANAVTLQAGPNVIVSGGAAAASLLLVADTPVRLKYFTGQWVHG